MGKVNWSVVLVLMVFILVSWVGFYIWLKQKTGFILNQRVFEEFKGTKILQEKITRKKQENAALLDSLSKEVARRPSTEIFQKYQLAKENLLLQEQQLTEQYTAEVWTRINRYISTYGKERGYDFILGASGNGSLMYARESVDITKEVIEYMNKEYDGK